MPDLDLRQLRVRAQQATPGPWTLSGSAGDAVVAPRGFREGFDDEDYRWYGGALVGESMRQADREYLRAFDPPTVLRLLDALEAARQDRDGGS